MNDLAEFFEQISPISKKVVVITLALATFTSGFFTLASAFAGIPESRIVSLIVGFSLMILSVNIFKCKERAFRIVLALSVIMSILHLIALDFSLALVSSVLAAGLLYTRDMFVVKSAGFNFRVNADEFIVTIILLLSSVIAGLWVLGPLEMLTMCICLTVLAMYFKPVELVTDKDNTTEFALAREILEKYDSSSLGYFKVQEDKSLFFSQDRKSFVAYRVTGAFAIVLGDPVGPEELIAEIITEFERYCHEHDWKPVFFQTHSACLELYAKQGFHKLKIGDEAIVNLETFTIQGKKKREHRYKINKFEKEGFQINDIAKPLDDRILAVTQEISNQWLKIEGKRERYFSLGSFERNYIRETSMYLASDENNSELAFVNLIPSYVPGELAIDLMRRRHDALKGIMDFLFVKLLLDLQAKGVKRLSMGLAPMSGFEKHEKASIIEQAIHKLFQGLNFLFNYAGLRMYKDKFANEWEPRYLVYKNINDLPQIGLAINKVLESKA